MIIHLKIVYLSFVVLVLAACSSKLPPPLPSPAVKSPLPTPPSILEIISPVQPTSTSTPVVTPSPTVPVEPTATALPPLVWADSIAEAIIDVGTFSGEWSPVANELLLHNCISEVEKKVIARANAPDFAPADITPKDYSCSNWESPPMTWTPDGQNIIYGIRFDPRYNEISNWLMDRNGYNPHPINIDKATGEYPRFWGWMDAQTLIYQHYGKGGWNYVSPINVYTGELVAFADIPGSIDRFQFNPDYIGATTFREMRPSAIVIPKEGDVRRAPIEQLNKDTVVTYFKGWLPSTNKMFMLMTGEDNRHRSFSQLLLWNVDTDTISILVSDAVGGQISPDGKTLAYVTCGPAQIDHLNKPIPRGFPTNPLYCEGVEYYLQLFDMKAGQIMVSLPIINHCVGWAINACSEDISVKFSPNGRYVGFFSPGLVERDESSNHSSSHPVYLNILDRVSRQIIYSRPGAEILPVWAPDSSKFIYFNELNNPIMFSLADSKTTLFAKTGGQRVRDIQWSFDGQYLSFLLQNDKREHSLAVLSTN